MLTGKPGNISSLELAFIIQEKGFKIEKTYWIKRRENLNVLCFQAFNLAPNIGCPHLATRFSISATRWEQNITTKFPVPLNSRVKH